MPPKRAATSKRKVERLSDTVDKMEITKKTNAATTKPAQASRKRKAADSVEETTSGAAPVAPARVTKKQKGECLLLL